MSFDLLDDLENESDSEASKPFHAVASKKSDDKLAWLNTVFGELTQEAIPRTNVQRNNLSMYRGISESLQDRRKEYSNGRRLNKVNKFIVNHLFDLTETKVSQMTRIKPSIEVLPANAEYSDKSAAKVVGMLIKHLWYINNIDYNMIKMHRHARIFGESFMFVTWNSSFGDKHPAYAEAEAAGLKSIQLPDGSTQSLKDPIMTGDVEYELEVPWRVLLQRATSFEKCDYVFRINVVPTEDLKKDYPSKKNKISTQEDLRIFDIESQDDKFVENHSVVIEFFHKHTKYLPKGQYIKFTKDVILESKDLPYSHGKLPIVRLTDLDIPDSLNGVSKYESIANVQRMYNNLSTLIAKNIYMTAHAKWMMPRGAAKLEQLGNDNTIIQYQGPVPPTLVQTHSNPAEVYAFRASLKEEMQTLYGSHGISRGEVPKGITAASALQYLNELENDRASTDIAKHGFLVKDIAKMTVSVAGDYYDMDDGRMMRVVGKDNEYLIRYFDTANLDKDYDIRLDNSSGLPESKAAKIQRILEVMQRNPNLFSPERWEELLEFGNTDQMIKLSTAAIKAADSENEDLLAGEPVRNPEDFEDHIAHWESHVKVMQSRSFKDDATNEIQADFKEHVYWTEELMIEKMGTNPLFQAHLSNLKLFPIFYHESLQAPPQSAEQQAAVVNGQANKGEQVTGAIPGTDAEDTTKQRDNQRSNK